MDPNLFAYFIEKTDERFGEINRKLDKLMALRAQILLLAGISSACVSLVVSYLVRR